MKQNNSSRRHTSWKHWRSTVINLGTIFALLMAVSFLPADTSLSQIKDRGVLKLCVPEHYAPFVTDDDKRPGYDVELVQAIADQLGVRLAVNKMASIGRDYNPRNWMLSRGQCDIVAGGMADTVMLRNFMQTIPTNIELGWVLISKADVKLVEGDDVYVLPGNTGLNRLKLSSWLRGQQINAKSLSELRGSRLGNQRIIDDIHQGVVKGLITENFTACTLLDTSSAEGDITASWLIAHNPEESDEHVRAITSEQTNSMALSLWKGDITLKKAVVAAMTEIEKKGIVNALREFYIGDNLFCVS